MKKIKLFFKNLLTNRGEVCIIYTVDAEVAELVDAHV